MGGNRESKLIISCFIQQARAPLVKRETEETEEVPVSLMTTSPLPSHWK
jgi:hypothetical protein